MQNAYYQCFTIGIVLHYKSTSFAMQNNLYSNAKQLLLQYQTTIIGLHLHFSLHKKQLYLESKTVIYENRPPIMGVRLFLIQMLNPLILLR